MHVKSNHTFDINCHCDSSKDFLANSYFIVQIYHTPKALKVFIKTLKSVVQFNVHKTLYSNPLLVVSSTPKMLKNWIVDQSTACNFTVYQIRNISSKITLPPLCCSVVEAVLFTQGSMTFFCVTNEVQGLKYELLVFALGR